jgi:hypothetical protein
MATATKIAPPRAGFTLFASSGRDLALNTRLAAGHGDALSRANGRGQKQRYKYSEKNLIHDERSLLPRELLRY